MLGRTVPSSGQGAEGPVLTATEVSKRSPFTVGKDSAGVLEIHWNPSHDSAILVPFGELYALTHTIQHGDAFRREDKQVSDSSEWREPAQSVERSRKMSDSNRIHTIRFYCCTISAYARRTPSEPIRSDLCHESGPAKVARAG